MELARILALTGGLLNIVAFWFYNRSTFFSTTRPNAATCSLWMLVTQVNFWSYYFTKVDWTTLVVMGSDTTLCTVTFAFLLFAGKFGRLNKREWHVVGLTIVALLAWAAFSAKAGNLMVQLPMILSFFPILQDVKDGKTIEDLRVWVLWTASFIVSLIVVCITHSHREEFVYPVVAIVMHGIILCYAIRGKRLYSQPA